MLKMSLPHSQKIVGLLRTIAFSKSLKLQILACSKFVSSRSFACPPCCHMQQRLYSGQRETNKSVSKAAGTSVGDAKPITFKEKVKENTKTTWYGTIMLVGLGVTGVMFYAIFRELFSSKSPNSVYSAALARCAAEPRVLDALGEPVKGYGEETRRGRRRHVSHLLYQQNGRNHMRMKFYIKGSRQTGTVQLDMREDPDTGRYEYRYLFVEVDGMSRRVIVLEDNRAAETRSLPELPPLRDYSQPRPESGPGSAEPGPSGGQAGGGGRWW